MDAIYQNVVVLTVVAGLPFLSWAVSGPKRSEFSLLFLVGTGFFAAAAAVYLFKPELPPFWTPVIIRSLVYSAILLINEFVRRTINRRRPLDVALWAIAVIVVPLSVVLEFRIGVVGVVVHHSFMVLLQVTVLGNLFALYLQSPSRGLICMGSAVVVVLAANLSQVLSAALVGVVLQPNLEGAAGLTIYLANILWVMLFSIGYWSYTVDVTKRAEVQSEIARATEQQRRKTAETLAEEMSKLIRERDELIMMNSRFETLSNVGVFNAAVIHELSQPVQKILTKIEFLSHSSNTADDPLRKTLREIHENATTTSEVIHAVRSLLVDSSSPASFVAANSVLSVVRPIVESQAKADRVWLAIDSGEFPEDYGIVVNPVLLNRVILNLSSNALTALRGVTTHSGPEAPRLEIRVSRESLNEADLLRIDVWDNGKGFPHGFDSTLKTLSKTNKPGGMGLGLVLSRQIMATWRGTMSVAQRNGGTEVSCSIPLVRRDSVRTARA